MCHSSDNFIFFEIRSNLLENLRFFKELVHLCSISLPRSRMEQSPTEQVDKKPTIVPSPPATLTVEQLDIEILPVIYDIIRSVEKDPVDNTAKQRESQECSQKILELQKRFESARNQIKQLPGIDYNKEEQLQKLEQLKNQLILKQQLIKKYKNIQF